MAETTKVVAKMRDRAGKGGARSSRREGLIPAVIYGDKQPPVMIAVEPKTIERELQKEGYFNHRLKIAVDGYGLRRPAARRPGRSGHGQAPPSRLPADRTRLDHHRAGARPLQERSGVSRHQARRRAERRAARDHRAHQGRQDSGVLRGRSDRSRDRPLDPHVDPRHSRGRARGDSRQQRHRGVDCRTDRGARNERRMRG